MAGKASREEKRIAVLLKRISVLTDLSTEQLLPLARDVELNELRRRYVIYLPSDPSQSVFMIASGRVKISRVTRDGRELTLSYRGAGEIFGDNTLFAGGAREEMAEAVDDLVLLSADRSVFETLLGTDPRVALRLLKASVQRRRALENRIEQLIFRDVTSKLADLLLALAEQHGVAHAGGQLLGLKITHQELANLVGSTRETVSLTLAQFKERGLVRSEGRKLIVSDSAGLKALA
jgi:CRP/FNR family transcriptional regulator, cyclic AMP receptor protein